MATTKNRAGRFEEWIGGLISRTPDDSDAYDMLFWMFTDGTVLRRTVGKPGELLPRAAEDLRDAVRAMTGGPPRPLRVRVASPAFAEALRKAPPRDVEIVCAPTPEVKWAVASLGAHDGEVDESLMEAGAEPEMVASFFRATAELFRACPWGIMPSDESLLSVSIPGLEVKNMAVSVFGQWGKSRGVHMISNRTGLEDNLDIVKALRHGEKCPGSTETLALRFEPVAALSGALQREIAEHQWEMADKSAFPRLRPVDSDPADPQQEGPPTTEEFTLAEAVARTLLELVPDKRALLAAWRDRTPFARTLRVPTFEGEFEVKVRAPFPTKVRGRYDPPYNVVAHLAELKFAREANDDGEPLWVALYDELYRRFVESPEGRAIKAESPSRQLIHVAWDKFRVTVATMNHLQLRKIIFEILPREGFHPTTTQETVIEETKAFYRFLKRAFKLPQADACLLALDDDGGRKLEAMRRKRQRS